MYGLKQVPHAWYEKIYYFFINYAFKCCESDHNIYVLHIHGNALIVSLYVDDLVIVGNNVDLILGLKRQLTDSFEMTDLRLLRFFMGIPILQRHDGIFLSQPKYVLSLLKRFNMDDCKQARATHFMLSIKLTKECDSPRVNTTLYR